MTDAGQELSSNDGRTYCLRAGSASQEIDAGACPDFLPETARHPRQRVDASRPFRRICMDRRVEITGPVDRKMIINALNSGANVFMADFEDSNSPTWQNMIDGQVNLRDAVKRHDQLHQPRRQEVRARRADRARLMVRPRGWHLDEKHFLVDGKPISGVAFRFRPVLLSQRPDADRERAPARTSICRSWRAISKRACGTTFSSARRTTRHPARDHPRHRPDRDHPRRIRDGRNPLGTARALRRAELRALGLHLQLHQEIPQPRRFRAAGPRAGHHGRGTS